MIETVNQAMNALDAYWAKHGTPDTGVIALIRRTLEEHSSSCDDDWKALLDKSLQDMSYRVDWDDETIQGITQPAEDRVPDPLSGSF